MTSFDIPFYIDSWYVFTHYSYIRDNISVPVVQPLTYSANPGGGRCIPAIRSLFSRAYCIRRLRLSADFTLSIS